jgi:signal transduction histidine kinase
MRSVSGLRPRLLAALLATSAVTLVAAALALLPPLRDRLRDQSVHNTRSATTALLPGFEGAVSHRDCDALARLLGQLAPQSGGNVYVVDVIPQPFCADLADPHAGGDAQVQGTLTTGIRSEELSGNHLELVEPLGRGTRPAAALLVRKTLNDVAGATHTVRTAFLKAAFIGLGVALLLGLGFAATLLRRLERLRRAAQRVTTEGAGAPRPHDEGRDEIGDLARSFAAMQAALARQEEARRAFVATASHELRTPLTSLSGMLELLDEDLAEGRLDVPDAVQQVAAARNELRRLNNLAAELLDLSRLDAGVPLRLEPVELGELSRAVASEFAVRAADNGVELDVVPPVGPCWASGDPGAVARVLRILLDNALRFSPPGSAIRVAARYAGDEARFEVADAGPGVPESERELIFKRFQRGSSTGGEGGFGLGLAIGRELAERLGGSLRLEDSDSGARFVCALPVELPGRPTVPGQEPQPAGL